jgi:hypothetical protein
LIITPGEVMPIGREPADRNSEGTADGIEDGTADET